MSPTEADREAAIQVIDWMRRATPKTEAEFRRFGEGEFIDALDRIETWLRRRACLGDKQQTSALERELGRTVKPTGKAEK